MDVNKRFFSASDDKDGRDPKTGASKRINEGVKHLAQLIQDLVPEGRQKNVALTELEHVQMRANRGIFSEDKNR